METIQHDSSAIYLSRYLCMKPIVNISQLLKLPLNFKTHKMLFNNIEVGAFVYISMQCCQIRYLWLHNHEAFVQEIGFQILYFFFSTMECLHTDIRN